MPHDAGDVLWGCAALAALVGLNIATKGTAADAEDMSVSAVKMGMVRISYSQYLLCQVSDYS